MRSGKVQNNASTSDGGSTWRIGADGFTKALRDKVPGAKFEAHLSGYAFGRYTPTQGADDLFNDAWYFQAPHLHVREIVVSEAGGDYSHTVNDNDYWLCAEGGYAFHSNINLLWEAVMALLEADQATLNCAYTRVGNDLVFEVKDQVTNDQPGFAAVQVAGVVPWILGMGYFHNFGGINAEYVAAQCNSATPFWAKPRNYEWAQQSDGGQDTPWGSQIPPTPPQWLYLRNVDDEEASAVMGQYNNFGNVVETPPTRKLLDGTIKNESECAYYYDWDYDAYTTTQASNPTFAAVINNVTETDRELHLTYSSNVGNLEVGNVLTFGDPEAPSENLFGDETAVPRAFLQGEITAISGTTGSDQTLEFEFNHPDGTVYSDSLGRPDGGILGSVNYVQPLYWCPNYREEDLYKVTDPYGGNSPDTPSDIFKTLLGIRTGALGTISDRRKVTTIKHLFGANNNTDRTLVDWDEFDQHVGGSSVRSDVAHYELKLDDGKSVSILDALNAVCITHGVQMTYGYRESQRAKVLGFKPFKGESVADISNNGKVVASGDIEPKAPTAQVGGTWLYSAVVPTLKDANGSEIPINARPRVGNSSAPTYSYTDNVTIMKVPIDGNETPMNLANNLYDYITKWATPHFMQSIPCAIAPAAVLEVGAGCLYSSDFILDRDTGARGISDRAGDLSELSETWGATGNNLGLKVQVNNRSRLGLAPSMQVDSNNVTLDSSDMKIDTLITDGDNNIYNGKFMPEPAWFSCIRYNKGKNALELKPCSCGDFGVVVFEEDTSTLTDVGGSRNVWYGSYNQATLAEIVAGTATITLESTTNFATVLTALQTANGFFGVDFIDTTNAVSKSKPLRDCQRNLYGFLGTDTAGTVDFGSGDVRRAIEWG